MYCSFPALLLFAGARFLIQGIMITITRLSELFAKGLRNIDIADLLVDEGYATSNALLAKKIGFVRNCLHNDNVNEVMKLTRTTTDGKGNVTETHSRRSIQDETIPDHLKVNALTTSPHGGQWRKYKSTLDTGAELKEELIKEIQALNIPYPNEVAETDMALEIMIADHHFGKIPYSYKTEDWTLENAKDEYLNALSYHLQNAPPDLATIILPLGNDLLHINSNTGTTKRGTPMEFRENYHRLYAFVRDVVASSIVSLSHTHYVQVVMVPGNHDEDACYRLGDYLEGLFDGSDRVTINNSGHDRKYVAWGKSLVCYTHGQTVKPQKLHDAFSVDVPHLNSAAKFRYVHVGHLHKNMVQESYRRTIKDEYLGTEVEICPSLSPTDNWHFDNLFTGNQRRSKSYLYSKTKGKVGEWFYNL